MRVADLAALTDAELDQYLADNNNIVRVSDTGDLPESFLERLRCCHAFVFLESRAPSRPQPRGCAVPNLCSCAVSDYLGTWQRENPAPQRRCLFQTRRPRPGHRPAPTSSRRRRRVAQAPIPTARQSGFALHYPTIQPPGQPLENAAW